MKASHNLVSVEPDFMAARFQIGLDALNKRNIGVVGVAEEYFHER